MAQFFAHMFGCQVEISRMISVHAKTSHNGKCMTGFDESVYIYRCYVSDVRMPTYHVKPYISYTDINMEHMLSGIFI